MKIKRFVRISFFDQALLMLAVCNDAICITQDIFYATLQKARKKEIFDTGIGFFMRDKIMDGIINLTGFF